MRNEQEGLVQAETTCVTEAIQTTRVRVVARKVIQKKSR